VGLEAAIMREWSRGVDVRVVGGGLLRSFGWVSFSSRFVSMRRIQWLLCCVCFVSGGAWVFGQGGLEGEAAQPIASKWPAISTSGFGSSIHHWRRIRDESRFIQALPDQPSYSPEQVPEIVANLLLFQRENGGWPKDYDMLAVLTDDQRRMVQETHSRTDTSFDNGNVHSQVVYLAQAYTASGNTTWKDACLRGLDFILSAQMENGGFPQRFPALKNYSAHITFNDGVMMGILDVLQDCSDGVPHWAWLDADRKAKCSAAVARGVECILKCQIVVQGQATGWCQQHDEKTFEAASARTFELASICPQETTEIVRFLMRIESPTPEVLRAMAAAVDWMKAVQLKGVKISRVAAPREEFQRHSADFDVVVVNDSKAPPLWARHYEIGTNRPIFAGRDGVKKYSLAEIAKERRTGTLWYGGWPDRLLKSEYPAWKVKHSE